MIFTKLIYLIDSIRDSIERVRKKMASLFIWLIGLLFLAIGFWIILLRLEGLADLVKPNSISIGTITVDGVAKEGSAELFHARFNHHFNRSKTSSVKETGFLEFATFESPELFETESLIDTQNEDVSVEVSGVNVTKLFKFFNQYLQPEKWILEGDFQTHSDRTILALRFRRGQRLIRTWYLERIREEGNSVDDANYIEQLIDDAVFQVVFDFSKARKEDKDLYKWKKVISIPNFSSRAALSAFYEAKGALGRYYSNGNWNDLDRALICLRNLRSYTPDSKQGLFLLGMTLSEKRYNHEAINIYEQLLLQYKDSIINKLEFNDKKFYFSYSLLKGVATVNLDTWQSTHDAIGELLNLSGMLIYECINVNDKSEKATLLGILSHTSIQLSYAYAHYFSYMRHHMMWQVFGSTHAPVELKVSNDEIEILKSKKSNPDEVKKIVHNRMKIVKKQFEGWLCLSKSIAEIDNINDLWNEIDLSDEEIVKLSDSSFSSEKNEIISKIIESKVCSTNNENYSEQYYPSATWWNYFPKDETERRKTEFISRLYLTSGYAAYRMAEWENANASVDQTIYNETYENRLKQALQDLYKADAAHPNHYFILQLLGMVYSESRHDKIYTDSLHSSKGKDLSIAEQFIDRSIRANPEDYFGHELLSNILYRRIANQGIDMANKDLINNGVNEAIKAIAKREISGQSHLLKAKYQLMLVQIEKDNKHRDELISELDKYISQADRFLPKVYENSDPDIIWLQIASRLFSFIQQINKNKKQAENDKYIKNEINEIVDDVDKLIKLCDIYKHRWVAQQRVFYTESLKYHATALKNDLLGIESYADLHDNYIPFW